MIYPIFDFDTFPVLHTDRLLLREILPSDADSIFAIRGDYEVTRHNIGPAYPDRSYATRLIESMAQEYQNKSELRWGITLVRLPDQVIGMAGYNRWARADERAQVGYDLERAAWGQGIMTEALHAVVQFGWACMRLNRIEADTSADNPASTRVLEKVGFTLEGRQREQYQDDDGFHDLLLYGLLRREYRPWTSSAHTVLHC